MSWRPDLETPARRSSGGRIPAAAADCAAARAAPGTDTGRSDPLLRLAALVGGSALVFCLAALIRLIVSTYDATPWHDEWYWLVLVERMSDGAVPWLTGLVSPHNEHRILFPRLVYLVDAFGFGARFAFVLAASLVVHGLHWLLAVSAGRSKATSPGAAVAAGLAGGCLFFSGYQASNFLWAFQVAWFLMTAGVTLALVALWRAGCRGASAPARAGWLGLAVGSALLAQYSIAGGIMAWPVLVAMAWLTRAGLPRGAWLTVAGTGAAATAAYFAGSPAGPGNVGQALQHPLTLLHFAALYLGSPLTPLGLPFVYAAGVCLLLFTPVLVIYLLRGAVPLVAFDVVVFGQFLFVVLLASATAAGRSGLGLSRALESTYGTPTLVAYGLLAMLAIMALARRRQFAAAAGVVAAIGAYAVISHLRLPYDYSPLPALKRQTASAFLVGVEDPTSLAQAGLIATVPSAASRDRLRAFLQRRHLSVFRKPGAASLGLPIAAIASRRYVGCGGFVDLVTPLGTAPAHQFRLSGWAWDAARGQPVDAVLFVDSSTRVVGLAYPGVARPDVAAAIPGAGDHAGWVGHAVTSQPEISAVVLDAAGASTCLLAEHVALQR